MKRYHAVLFFLLCFVAGWAFGDIRTGIGLAAISGLLMILVRALMHLTEWTGV